MSSRAAFHAGARLERKPGPKYLAEFRFAELAFVGPIPKPGTLKRWAEELPDDFVLSVLLPPTAWRTQQMVMPMDDEEFVEQMEYVREAVAALAPRFVVLETGAHLKTGKRDRDKLRNWLGTWREGSSAEVVWHPMGLWDPELALPFAKELDVIWGFDPLVAAAPNEGPRYGRLAAIGLRKNFTETLLLQTCDRLIDEGNAETFVAIHSDKSFREAKRLTELAREFG